MKTFRTVVFLLCALLALSGFSHGQAGTLCPVGTNPFPNDSVTGTTAFTLTKLNSSGNAVIMATTDTTGYQGVAVFGAGKAGTVCLANSGLWPVLMDATATVLHYVQISSTTGGDGKDTGATALPSSGGDIVGRVQQGCTGGGCPAMVSLFPPEIPGVNASGAGITGPGTSTVNDCVTWNSTVGSIVQDPGGCNVVNGTVHGANSFSLASTYTNSTISPTTIITSPTIAANSFVYFRCAGTYQDNTLTNGHMQLQINASQTPQAIWYALTSWTSTTANKGVLSTTNATLIDGGVVSAANTNFPWSMDGYIQWNATTAGTFTLQGASNTASLQLTVNAGAFCTINP